MKHKQNLAVFLPATDSENKISSNTTKKRTKKIWCQFSLLGQDFFVVVALLFYVLGKHLRSCRDGHLT